MNYPTTETDALITILREELQQYGVLLRLLEQHQGSMVEHRADAMLDVGKEIEQALSQLMDLRERRQEEIRSLTGIGNNPRVIEEHISLEGLLPYFPEMVAPMIRGLVEEVNRLVLRVSRFARHNHYLLSHALDSMPAFRRTFQPDSLEEAYTSLGGI